MLLFDGVCNLCSRTVAFLVRRQPQKAETPGTLRFAALQSPAAELLLAALDAPVPLPDSMIVVDGGKLYTYSDAALRLAKRLPFPWPLLTVFRIVPRPIRNWLYRLVARKRYNWFGKKETCMVPTADLRARFL